MVQSMIPDWITAIAAAIALMLSIISLYLQRKSEQQRIGERKEDQQQREREREEDRTPQVKITTSHTSDSRSVGPDAMIYTATSGWSISLSTAATAGAARSVATTTALTGIYSLIRMER